MNDIIKKFFSGIAAVKRKSGTYKKIKSIEDLLSYNSNLDFVDLSELDLSNFGDFFTSHPTGPFSFTGVHGWTENVIWPTPDKMPNGFNPQQYIDKNKHPSEIDLLHKNNITGRGINIAIIDNVFNPNHPEYKNNIKHLQVPLMKMKNNTPHFHGSMVVGRAVGKTTGVAPDAQVYYFTRAKSDQERGQETIAVLKSVLDFNKKQTTKNKINILSCSWAPQQMSTNDQEYNEIMNLFKKIETSGVKIIFCGGNKTKSSFAVSTIDFMPTSKDTESEYHDNIVYIPTNEKTAPYHTGGYVYQKLGSDSSAAPYLAGVYACALQDNQIFMSHPNWQQELDTIMKETAITSKNGALIINPINIRKRVSEIAHDMKMNLIKQKSTQHE